MKKYRILNGKTGGKAWVDDGGVRAVFTPALALRKTKKFIPFSSISDVEVEFRATPRLVIRLNGGGVHNWVCGGAEKFADEIMEAL